MSKSRKVSKSTLAILALSLILAVSLVFGATFAWYKADKTSGENKVTMGTFALSVKAGDTEVAGTAQEFVPAGAVWDAAVPNQLISLETLKIAVTSNVETVVRVKITVTGELDGFSLSLPEANWEEKDGYYYYKNAENYYLAANSSELSAELSARLASTLTTDVAGTDVSFTITVEAAQAGWTAADATVAGLPTSATEAAQVFANVA